MSLVCYPTIYAKPGKTSDIAKSLPVQDCFKNQPGTLAYYFFEPTQDDDQIQGIEIYTDEASLKQHGTADSFKEFGKATRGLFAKQFDLQQARPVCGFLTKGTESASQLGASEESGDVIAVLARILCQSKEARAKVLALATDVCKLVEQEAGTLSYHWSEDLKDETQIIVFERYADQAATAIHMKVPHVGAFMKEIKPLVKSSKFAFGSPVCGFLKKNPSLMESSKL